MATIELDELRPLKTIIDTTTGRMIFKQANKRTAGFYVDGRKLTKKEVALMFGET